MPSTRSRSSTETAEQPENVEQQEVAEQQANEEVANAEEAPAAEAPVEADSTPDTNGSTATENAPAAETPAEEQSNGASEATEQPAEAADDNNEAEPTPDESLKRKAEDGSGDAITPIAVSPEKKAKLEAAIAENEVSAEKTEEVSA